MKEDIIKKIFIAFLKRENIYEKYCIAMRNANCNIDEIFNGEIRFAFSGYFQWDKTKEGSLFWSGISNKWKKICIKMKFLKESLYDYSLPF